MDELLQLEREWRKAQENKLKSLINANAPDVLIDHQKSILNMTRLEYKACLQKESQIFEQNRKEYIKNNPLRKEIVDALYKKTDELPYDYWAYVSEMRFYLLLDYNKIVSENDSYYEIYDDIIIHCRDIYQEKYQKQYESNPESQMVH